MGARGAAAAGSAAGAAAPQTGSALSAQDGGVRAGAGGRGGLAAPGLAAVAPHRLREAAAAAGSGVALLRALRRAGPAQRRPAPGAGRGRRRLRLGPRAGTAKEPGTAGLGSAGGGASREGRGLAPRGARAGLSHGGQG